MNTYSVLISDEDEEAIARLAVQLGSLARHCFVSVDDEGRRSVLRRRVVHQLPRNRCTRFMHLADQGHIDPS